MINYVCWPADSAPIFFQFLVFFLVFIELENE